jgi:hypothetical protein
MGEHPTAGRTGFDRGQRFFQINATCLVKSKASHMTRVCPAARA